MCSHRRFESAKEDELRPRKHASVRAMRVVVIGGGPAGMMAAGRAAECGADVLLLEKGPKLGRKLSISGKGRGNISNNAELSAFIEAFAPKGKFLYGAFSRFFRDDLLDLLHEHGVETKTERGGRVFPSSDRASDVTEALTRWLEQSGARVRLNTRARAVELADGRVSGVGAYGGRMDANAVVIATGGASYPKTGATGDGYAIALDAGHSIVPPTPALSALVTEEDWVPHLQGLSLRNVAARLLVGPHDGSVIENPNKQAREFGEMIFTHFGISGPIVLTISRGVDALLKMGRVVVSIDLKPALSAEDLHARLIRDFTTARQFHNCLRDLLPRLMVDTFVSLVGIEAGKPANSITAQERGRIVGLLKDFRVTIKGMAPLAEAIVTAGGIPTAEVDSRTMMSKIVPGLFFAGEVIDVDAKTGGFNLQAAFSTGSVAGESAAEYVRCLATCHTP